MRFFRNPDGAVHSVPDDFVIPLGADDRPQHGWEEVDESEVPEPLRGSTTGAQLDPEVVPHELHDLAADPVPETVSSGHVGDDPETADPATPEHPDESDDPTGDASHVEGSDENPAAEPSDPGQETGTVTGEAFTPEATQ